MYWQYTPYAPPLMLAALVSFFSCTVRVAKTPRLIGIDLCNDDVCSVDMGIGLCI